LIVGLIAVFAAAIGLGSATAFAQEKTGEFSGLSLIARVANILGLEEQQVQNAFDEARQEMWNEAFDASIGQRLDALVESGRMTQEQADEVRAWYAERPDSFWLAGERDFDKRGGFHRGHMKDGRGEAGKHSLKDRFDRDGRSGSQWRRGSRGRGIDSFMGGYFFKHFSPDKDESTPASTTPTAPAETPTVTAPEATPTAPADSSDDN
jgi:hypothetical protein